MNKWLLVSKCARKDFISLETLSWRLSRKKYYIFHFRYWQVWIILVWLIRFRQKRMERIPSVLMYFFFFRVWPKTRNSYIKKPDVNICHNMSLKIKICGKDVRKLFKRIFESNISSNLSLALTSLLHIFIDIPELYAMLWQSLQFIALFTQ